MVVQTQASPWTVQQQPPPQQQLQQLQQLHQQQELVKSSPSSLAAGPGAANSKEQFIFAVPARKGRYASNMVEWKNTFNVRPVLLSALKARRQGLRQQGAGAGGAAGAAVLAGQSGYGAAKSLDLLRTNLQSAINKDIKQVLNKYLERFFQPAMENIRLNGGVLASGCLEEQVRAVLQRVLEEAKLMYCSAPLPPPAPRRHRKRSRSKQQPAPPPPPPPPPPPSAVVVKVNGSQVSLPMPPALTASNPATLQQMYRKRREMDGEAESRRKRARFTGLNGNVTLGPGVGAVIPLASLVAAGTAPAPAPAAAPTAAPTLVPTVQPQAVVRGVAALPLGVPLASTLATPLSTSTNFYLSPKWDPARVTPDTMFIMGARANKVLGYDTARGRLYSKHQDLFKYTSDSEDKEWLARNQLIQPTGGKVFVCILQDIHELAVSQEYKNNPHVNLLELKGFRAPEFLQRKIRAYMRNMRTEPLDDLSGLLEMDLLQEDGVTSMDDSSLMELALEYGVTLLSDDPAPPCPSPSTAAAVPAVASAAPAASTTARSASLTALPASLEALSTTTTPSSMPASPLPPSSDKVKALSRSQSLPAAPAAPAFSSEHTMMESLEELELYIKSQSVQQQLQQREEELFDHIMRESAAGAASDADAVTLDASLDASLEANLDANLDLNLDVNLDVSGAEHNNLELAWDFLEAEATIGELNTPSHSPHSPAAGSSSAPGAGGGPGDQDDFPADPGAVGAAVPTPSGAAPAAGETSLAMSHATLTALLAGNTLEGLEIPEGLL